MYLKFRTSGRGLIVSSPLGTVSAIRHCHIKRISNLLLCCERDVPLRPFDSAQKGPIQSGVQRYCLLRTAVCNTRQSDVLRQPSVCLGIRAACWWPVRIADIFMRQIESRKVAG